MIPIYPTKMAEYTRKNTDYVQDDDKMRAIFEDHMPMLRAKAEIIEVDPIKAHQFHHDLSGFLMDANIDIGLHWLIMRMNDKVYNWDFTEDERMLLIPNENLVDELIGQYQAVMNI